MSQTFSQTIWTFQLTTSNTNGYDMATLNAYAQNGMTDEWANAIYQALNGVTPPAGCQLQITVSKQDVSDTQYTTGTGTNPVTFT